MRALWRGLNPIARRIGVKVKNPKAPAVKRKAVEDWSGQHPALFKRYLGRPPKNLKPGATLHGANFRRPGAVDRLPLY
jgi:hypothetical protein